MTFHLIRFVLDEMLTQHEYDNISSQKSCYSSDTNATVSVVQRYLTTATVVSSLRVQNSTPEIKVESSTKEFLEKHFHDVRRRKKKISFLISSIFDRHIQCIKILVVNV